MDHLLEYLGNGSTSYESLLHGKLRPQTAKGADAKLEPRPPDIDGLVIGYMEWPGKKYFAVRVEDSDVAIALQVPVPIMRERHYQEAVPNEAWPKPFKNPRLDNEHTANLLRDAWLWNPRCRAILQRVMKGRAWRVPKEVFRLLWGDDYFTNYFLATEFARECENRPLVHRVGDRGLAFGQLTVGDREAMLDYTAFEKDNPPEEILLGRVRLTFTDSDRTKIEAVHWNEPGTQNWRDEGTVEVDRWGVRCGHTDSTGPRRARPDAENSVEEEDLPSSDEDARERQHQAVVVRRGQGSFRKGLLHAYAGRCAISGCAVEEVLEAAHILPYKGEHTNSVKNGLLLRSDLHLLFDRGRLWFDTSSWPPRIELADEVRHQQPYDGVHGRELRLPACEEDYPNPELLDLHRGDVNGIRIG